MSSSTTKENGNEESNGIPRNRAPSPPRWRFVNEAKKSQGYNSLAAGRVVPGKSAEELGAKYVPPTMTGTEKREVSEVGRLGGGVKEDKHGRGCDFSREYWLRSRFDDVENSGEVNSNEEHERDIRDDGRDDSNREETITVECHKEQNAMMETYRVDEGINDSPCQSQQYHETTGIALDAMDVETEPPNNEEVTSLSSPQSSETVEKPKSNQEQGGLHRKYMKLCILILLFFLLIAGVILGVFLGIKHSSPKYEQGAENIQVTGGNGVLFASTAPYSSPSNIPTSSPTVFDVWYPDITKGWDDGICIKKAPLPNGRITYDSQAACCEGFYGGQASHACIRDLPNASTESKSDAPFYPIWLNTGYLAGYCDNDPTGLKPGLQTHDTQVDCCDTWFPNQSGNFCLARLPTIQPETTTIATNTETTTTNIATSTTHSMTTTTDVTFTATSATTSTYGLSTTKIDSTTVDLSQTASTTTQSTTTTYATTTIDITTKTTDTTIVTVSTTTTGASTTDVAATSTPATTTTDAAITTIETVTTDAAATPTALSTTCKVAPKANLLDILGTA